MCSPERSNSVLKMQQSSGEGRKNDVRRWGISHVVATFSLGQRRQISAAMDRHARNSPWAPWLFADLIEGLHGSLPETDSWRASSFTIDVGGTAPMAAGDAAPATVGAVSGAGRSLASVDAFFDIDQPVFDSLEIDPVFAPVVDGVSNESAALVGAAGAGIEVLVAAIGAIPDADRFTIADNAIRWLLHRRTMYGDLDALAGWFAERVWAAEWRAGTIEAAGT